MTDKQGEGQQYHPMLEICVESFQDALSAVDAGADRIEYCSALAVGGLTPSPGAMERISDIPAPCMVMIRPRPGNFRYDASEIAIMKREISMAREHGAAGVVFGVLDDAGGLDKPTLKDLITACEGLQTTLHRAFDQLSDPLAGLEQAIELGFDRVLTSGGAPDAMTGRNVIAHLITEARNRIVVLPGAGVTAANASDILDVTGADELHASCKRDAGGSGYDAGRVSVDTDRVRALKAAMKR